MNELITFPAIAGVIVTVVTAVINRVQWNAKIKNLVALILAALLVVGGVLAELFPDQWQIISAGILSAYGVSQAIYAALKKPLQKLESATSGGTITEDIGDLLAEIDAELQPETLDEPVTGDRVGGRHALLDSEESVA